VAPGATPVTIPLTKPTVATEGLALVHVPPGVASFNVVVEPTHVCVVPVMAAGMGFTVKVVAVVHPVSVTVYPIEVVPSASVVTMPVADPIVAVVGTLLVHVPPGVGSIRVTVAPRQAPPGPMIFNGNGLTVTCLTAEQPMPEV
jgi:hypothetical protein